MDTRPLPDTNALHCARPRARRHTHTRAQRQEAWAARGVASSRPGLLAHHRRPLLPFLFSLQSGDQPAPSSPSAKALYPTKPPASAAAGRGPWPPRGRLCRGSSPQTQPGDRLIPGPSKATRRHPTSCKGLVSGWLKDSYALNKTKGQLVAISPSQACSLSDSPRA